MFPFASWIILTYDVKGRAAVGAHLSVIWVLSATLATVNHNSPSISFSFDSVLRLAVARTSFSKPDVGLPGFEPGSIEPKSTSLDQASRQPHVGVRENIISVAS